MSLEHAISSECISIRFQKYLRKFINKINKENNTNMHITMAHQILKSDLTTVHSF